jgi:hypothetical protein
MLAPIVEIFCDIDDFCKYYFASQANKVLPNPNRKRCKKCTMDISEIMTIVILFQLSHYRTFKDFYMECVIKHLRNYFPNLVSYNRFVELQSNVIMPLLAYLFSKRGQETNLYYIDSTPLKVCNNRRIYKHKVFKGLASRGKHSMGWFFGFKLHLVINHKGELMSFCFTKGNTSDITVMEKLFKNLHGLGVGDKGYLSKRKAENLENSGLKFVTKVRKNMKEKALTFFEKYFLSKRGIVETVIDQLKAICQIEHTRHRSPLNFITNLLGALAAYILRPRKPSLKVDIAVGNKGLLMSN